MRFKGSTLQQYIQYWATYQPDKKAFIYISGDEVSSVSFKEIYLKSLALSNKLESFEGKSKCIINMYPAGIDFIIGFFSSILSGSIAVPVNMPKGNRSNEKIIRIIRDCDTNIILSTKSGIDTIKSNDDFEEIPRNVNFIETEDYSDYNYDNIFQYGTTGEENDIAFLQYTSGSTSFPKGVEIRHKNLIYNLQMLKNAFEITNDDVVGTWLPHFHDMGLIGSILNAFYNGVTCVMMSPLMFMKSPVSWFKMITDYKVTITGGPNFAYDYCVSKIRQEQLTDIDLSSWQLAFNGAEPIFYDSIVKFANQFEKVGFNIKNFYPAYGMAEASVFVSGNKKSSMPKAIYVDYNELSRNVVKQLTCNKNEKNSLALVCCGNTWLDQEIIIVDINTREKLNENEIGEICVSGDNVTYGYWGKEEINKEKFINIDIDGQTKRFYSTGDLGFFSEGGLYITGRKDDVMIINGVNVYPQDIERIVEKTLNEGRLGAVCAFEVTNGNDREIVVLAELQRVALKRLSSEEAYFTETTNAILENISRQFDFQINELVFLSPGSVCKTSSGKICRKENKKAYLDGKMTAVKEWKFSSSPSNKMEENVRIHSMMNTFEKVNAAGFMQFKIFSSIVKLLSSGESCLDIMDLDVSKSLFFYGVDSLKIFDIHLALEKEYDVKIPTEIFFDSSDLLTILNRIARVLESKREHAIERTSVKLIDEVKKYEEIVLEKMMEVGYKSKPVISYDSLENILITGGAGFVGGFVLKECLLQTKANIYCLVRAKSNEHGVERIIDNLYNYGLELNSSERNRIKIVLGDISKDDLGIGQVNYNELARKIDLVIHCAAIDNFYLPYFTLKAANVDGLKNIMMFSLHGKLKPMIYTASCSASLIDKNMDSDKLFGIVNGYSQTKYVAQELLLNMIKKGFPGVCVKLGYLYANESNVVHPQEGFESLISSIHNIGAIPNIDACFDLTSVEYVAKSMAHMALHYSNGIMDNYLLYNPRPLNWKDIKKSFVKLDPNIKEVSLEEFVDLFQKYACDSRLKSLKFVSRVITTKLEEQFNRMFQNQNVDCIDEYMHKCPPCDGHFSDYYIDMVIKYATSDVHETKKGLVD